MEIKESIINGIYHYDIIYQDYSPMKLVCSIKLSEAKIKQLVNEEIKAFEKDNPLNIPDEQLRKMAEEYMLRESYGKISELYVGFLGGFNAARKLLNDELLKIKNNGKNNL